MKRFLFILWLGPVCGQCQNFHFAARLGVAGYQGDLKAKGITLSQTRLMGSLGAVYDLSEHLAARGYISVASLHADDRAGNTAMQQRNLNFTSGIIDGEISLQYNLFSLNEHWWTPYLFAGAGLYHFNPYTKDSSGKKYDLQPLGTEGEGFVAGVRKYHLTQFSIPFGAGADYALNEDMRLGLEFGYRKLFTDYLDDVSGTYVDRAALLNARGPKAVELAYRGTGAYPAAGVMRGNNSKRDGYYFIAVTYTIRYFFDKYKQIAGLYHSRKEKRVGCPATRNVVE